MQNSAKKLNAYQNVQITFSFFHSSLFTIQLQLALGNCQKKMKNEKITNTA